MRLIKSLTDYEFLNLKEVKDDDLKVKAYLFAERKGKDSVAFILYNKITKNFILNKEPTPPTGDFKIRAFGGSIDKEKSFKDIVKDEVLEEVGYDVDLKNIEFIDKVFVSTQMNQYCHLYLVSYNEKQKTKRKPENETEALAETVNLTKKQIIENDDWKAITIIAKMGL